MRFPPRLLPKIILRYLVFGGTVATVWAALQFYRGVAKAHRLSSRLHRKRCFRRATGVLYIISSLLLDLAGLANLLGWAAVAVAFGMLYFIGSGERLEVER